MTQELEDVLEEIKEYLDDHSDADHNGISYVPNKAMRLLMDLQVAMVIEKKVSI